jgi:hypothetical protein
LPTFDGSKRALRHRRRHSLNVTTTEEEQDNKTTRTRTKLNTEHIIYYILLLLLLLLRREKEGIQREGYERYLYLQRKSFNFYESNYEKYLGYQCKNQRLQSVPPLSLLLPQLTPYTHLHLNTHKMASKPTEMCVIETTGAREYKVRMKSSLFVTRIRLFCLSVSRSLFATNARWIIIFHRGSLLPSFLSIIFFSSSSFG